MALTPRSHNRLSVENRRCPKCERGSAMTKYDGGRFCRFCGFDPAEAYIDDLPMAAPSAAASSEVPNLGLGGSNLGGVSRDTPQEPPISSPSAHAQGSPTTEGDAS